MSKQRKLFCEYGPICYQISLWKEAKKKDWIDFKEGKKFAKKIEKENFEYIWKSDAKILLRKLHGVDMQLQKNKVVNLKLASKKIDGIIVEPGKEFSFWNLVGNATKRKGYLEGLVISNSQMKKGVGRRTLSNGKLNTLVSFTYTNASDRTTSSFRCLISRCEKKSAFWNWDFNQL